MPDQSTSITVVSKVYHRAFGEDPKLIDSSYNTPCKAHEQLFTRRTHLTGEWKPLEIGWFDSDTAGMIVIQNPKVWTTTVPTDEKKAEMASLVVEVSFSSNPNESIIIPPGEDARFRVAKAGSLKIRCAAGVAHQAIVNVFPK